MSNGISNPPPPVDAASTDANTPAVQGSSFKLGKKKSGEPAYFLGDGVGVLGMSGGNDGVLGSGKNGVHGQSSSAGDSGVWGENTGNGYGVSGSTTSDFVAGAGVTAGVWGNNAGGGAGVKGISQGGDGVVGFSYSSAYAGVSGTNTAGGYGVLAQATGPQPNTGGVAGHFSSDGNVGVYGESQSSAHAGVYGINNSGGNQAGKGGPGVYGSSSNLDGVQGWSQSKTNAGVSAHNTAGGYGVWAQAKTAGYFDGDVQVTGDVTLTGQDCAEHFDIIDASTCDPGTVMVIDDTSALVPSFQAYDRRVAGVVSGAGTLRPGLILGQQADSNGRRPIALVGTVYCKVDATYGAIEIGDLLTTSPTPGHAMPASDPLQAFGAVIGKALRPLATGTGLIPILVALQ